MEDEDDPGSAYRPTNGLSYHLASRTPTFPLSFVTEILMSAFPYLQNIERPQTAPPMISHSIRDVFLPRDQGERNLRHFYSSPMRRDMERMPIEELPRPYSSIMDRRLLDRNISIHSCPHDSFDRQESGRRGFPFKITPFSCLSLGDVGFFQIEEEQTEVHAFSNLFSSINVVFRFRSILLAVCDGRW